MWDISCTQIAENAFGDRIFTLPSLLITEMRMGKFEFSSPNRIEMFDKIFIRSFILVLQNTKCDSGICVFVVI